MNKLFRIIIVPLTILLFISSTYSARSKQKAMEYAINNSIIHYALPQSSPVDLRIYSIKGQLIYEINKPELEAGNYSLNINKCLSKDYYIIQFTADKFKSTKNFVVVR